MLEPAVINKSFIFVNFKTSKTQLQKRSILWNEVLLKKNLGNHKQTVENVLYFSYLGAQKEMESHDSCRSPLSRSHKTSIGSRRLWRL